MIMVKKYTLILHKYNFPFPGMIQKLLPATDIHAERKIKVTGSVLLA
jgi:hypothetical protein